MSYIGNEPIVSATRTVTEITATAGQTTFTANGGYTVGYIDVFVNGAQLQTSDFTATNGTTITLNAPAALGDDIRLVAWGTFSTSNLVSPNYSGTLTGGTGVVNIGSGQLYKDASGNVGLGTSTPIRTLTVSSPSSAEFVLQDRSQAANARNMRLYNSAGNFVIGTLNDAGTSGSTYLNINNNTGVITGNGRNLSPAIVPSGSVIQVQHNIVTTNYVANSASYVQVTAFNQTFTPLYASSRVLVILSTGINLICDGSVALTRNGSIVKDTWFGSTRADDQFDYPQTSGFYLDSPGTTSTVTYGIQVRATGCSNIIRIGGSDNHQSWTFMEIAA